MDTSSFLNTPINVRYGRLLSCSLPCDGVSLQDFLRAAEGGPRFYWASDSSQIAFAGAGTAVELMEWGDDRFDRIARRARELFAGAHVAEGELPAPRLFGGFAFRPDFTPDNIWSIYTPAWFVLPHYQLSRGGEGTWLTINTQVPASERPADVMPALTAALRAKRTELTARRHTQRDMEQSAVHSIHYPMPYTSWASLVDEATDRIRGSALNKVVLARAAELRFAAGLNLLPILRHLATRYSDCYRFLFEPRRRYAFYGASPELLASVRGRQLETVALAGSLGRGDSAKADARLGQQLLKSAKNLHEHQIVVDKMRQRLAPVASAIDMSPVRLLKLHNIQHLLTPIAAKLKRETGVLPLVEALHPTPALGGDPRPLAMRVIRELEPIPRGWYGAPVGWIDARLEGQFAVAIRSAVVQEARAWIYAGAGIVADSEPQDEWHETDLKFRPMLEAHGV